MTRLAMKDAPRDGTAIIVGDDSEGEFLMSWNATAGNPLVQGDTLGIWETPDKAFTWSEYGGCGPSYWRRTAS